MSFLSSMKNAFSPNDYDIYLYFFKKKGWGGQEISVTTSSEFEDVNELSINSSWVFYFSVPTEKDVELPF